MFQAKRRRTDGELNVDMEQRAAQNDGVKLESESLLEAAEAVERALTKGSTRELCKTCGSAEVVVRFYLCGTECSLKKSRKYHAMSELTPFSAPHPL